METTENTYTVIGLCGSLRPGSYTRMALQIALNAAQRAGAQTRLLDLTEYELVFCNGSLSESALPPAVQKLRDEMQRAQAIILATPEYHGSFSGALKNALDLLDGSELKGKVIGLISVAGGALSGLDALQGLRIVCRSLHAWAMPEQVAIPEAWKVFESNGKLKNVGLEKRLQELGRGIVRYAHLFASSQNAFANLKE